MKLSYEKLLKAFLEVVEHDINKSTWVFEFTNKLQFFNTEQKIKALDDEIERIVNMLDTGYPFVSYNFKNGLFDELNFISVEGLEVITSNNQNETYKSIAQKIDDGINVYREYDLLDTPLFLEAETTYIRAKHLEYFFNLRVKLQKQALPPQQTEKPKPEQEHPETLGSIITHEKADTLVSGIKTQYKNIKGKRLKLLLIALQELELLPKERIAKKFHALCKNEFNWEIASYNAMNGYNFNRYTDTDEVEGMKQYIKTLLNIK